MHYARQGTRVGCEYVHLDRDEHKAVVGYTTAVKRCSAALGLRHRRCPLFPGFASVPIGVTGESYRKASSIEFRKAI